MKRERGNLTDNCEIATLPLVARNDYGKAFTLKKQLNNIDVVNPDYIGIDTLIYP